MKKKRFTALVVATTIFRGLNEEKERLDWLRVAGIEEAEIYATEVKRFESLGIRTGLCLLY